MKPLLPAFALALALAAPAHAGAEDSFREGRWTEATREGRAEATVESLIYAGRAGLWLAGYETRDKNRAEALIAAAEKDFDAALVKAPGNMDALLQKAAAIGYRAKLAKSPGLAKDCRDRFTAIRDKQPGNPLAWSAVASWHGGAVASLGGFMASAVLGAKASEFEAGYARVFRLAPRNPAYRTLYAIGLLDLTPKNAAKAATALKGIETLPAEDAFERALRNQGVQLAAALAAGDAKAAQTLARRLSAFGTLA